jgi:pectate lyase
MAEGMTLVGDVMKSLIARLFAASVVTALTVAAGVPWKSSHADIKGREPPPQLQSVIDPARFGMPNADTAGVPAGVTLTNYTGPMNITKPGTVIDGKIINGQLNVYAANVTIRNCIIRSDGWWGIEGEQASNLRVENCDIIGGNLPNSGILGAGTFVGNDISHVSIGIQLTGGASTVRGNYIHDLFYGNGDPHYDGITLLGGQNHVIIEHNTFSVPQDGGTASILIGNNFGPVNDVLINNNLMLGDPSYTVYFNKDATNIVFTNNYVERGYYGYYVSDGAMPPMSGNVQWDNRKDPIPYPR